MNREILKAKIAEAISSTNTSGNEKLEAILAAVDAYSSARNGTKPLVSRSFSEQEVYGIWQFADAQLQIIKAKKEASKNHVEMMCLSFTANCIVDIMDTIADMLEPVNCG